MGTSRGQAHNLIFLRCLNVCALDPMKSVNFKRLTKIVYGNSAVNI